MKIDNNSFVRIKTFFDKSDRSISTLSNNYYDKELLTKSIAEIMGNEIDFNGKRVLLKPNWVSHPLKESDQYTLYTHPNFILALVEFILNNYKPIQITIGDAPVQDCIWEKIHSLDFINKIDTLSKVHKISILIKDFRRVSYNLKENSLHEELNPISDYLIFDLGSHSKLEPITNVHKNKFRITNYDPRRMKDVHKKGMHKYCIIKEFFEQDIIITLPKIKTHQKAGITGALKILVGINGDKDFLPHHRKGGSEKGGDCYPGKNKFRNVSEIFLDIINKYRGTLFYKIALKFVFRFWNTFLKSPYHSLGASWYGNDTVWRMVSDINTIALYGQNNGVLDNKQQRIIYSLSDGIIGGEGNGPLQPDPLELGVMMFSNSSLLHDLIIAELMQFDYRKIPILKNIPDSNLMSGEISVNGKEYKLKDISKLSIKTRPANGWIGHIESFHDLYL